MLVPFAHHCVLHLAILDDIRHLEVAEFMCGKDFQSCLRPFVESLKHGDCQCVLHREMPCAVIYGVTTIGVVGIQVVISFGIIVSGGIVGLIDTPIVVEIQCMYDARHRHILFLECVGKCCFNTVSQCFIGLIVGKDQRFFFHILLFLTLFLLLFLSFGIVLL